MQTCFQPFCFFIREKCSHGRARRTTVLQERADFRDLFSMEKCDIIEGLVYSVDLCFPEVSFSAVPQNRRSWSSALCGAAAYFSTRSHLPLDVHSSFLLRTAYLSISNDTVLYFLLRFLNAGHVEVCSSQSTSSASIPPSIASTISNVEHIIPLSLVYQVSIDNSLSIRATTRAY